MKHFNTLSRILAGVVLTLSCAVANAAEEGAIIGGDAPDQDRSASTTADDAVITSKVKTNLLGASDVGGMKIDVDTRSGVVYLTSDRMKSQSEIDKAIQVAKETSGVKDVVSKLTVDAD